jgi:hypothetical protein
MVMKTILNPHSRIISRMRIDAYECIAAFIIETLKRRKEMTLLDLLNCTAENSGCNFGTDTQWYTLKVKQDLEARKVIKITRDLREGGGQLIRLFHYKDFENTIRVFTSEH